MLPKPELAYFAIADISGYTSFLAGVELDHEGAGSNRSPKYCVSVATCPSRIP
jgi:hypothetical protein